MLRAACLVRQLLAKPPAVSLACSVSSTRLTANGIAHQPTWKPPIAARWMNTNPSQERVASPATEASLREKDKLPADYHIIYRAPLQTYITVTYLSAWVSILFVPVVIGSMLFLDDATYPYEIAGVPVFETSTDAYIVTGMLLLVVFNIANTVSKYPFRIYRHAKEDKYVAVFQHALPGLISKKEFAAGELKKSSGWIWKESCYSIKNKKVLIIPEHFSRPIELERMQIDPKKIDPVEIRKRRSKML